METYTKNDFERGPEIQDGRRRDAKILLKTMPPEYIKDMSEQLAQGKHEDDYFSFEQALFEEINTRKMDEDGRINVLNNSSGEEDKVKRNADGIEYEEVEIWSVEWQCNICGLAQKRSRSGSRSRGEDDEQDGPTKARTGDKGQGRGKRPGGPRWMWRATLPERVLQLVQRWTAVSHHHGVDIVTTRLHHKWNSWLPKPYKGKRQGKKQRQRKRRKG